MANQANTAIQLVLIDYTIFISKQIAWFANDAKSKRDYIWSIAKGKYTAWHEGTDKNGFKYYESGISPKGGGLNTGFIVDVVKYDKAFDGCYYCARIMYGPYNYVKEEF